MEGVNDESKTASHKSRSRKGATKARKTWRLKEGNTSDAKLYAAYHARGPVGSKKHQPVAPRGLMTQQIQQIRVPDHQRSTTLLPVGVVRSCFRECRGTPRQGFFAPATKGRIEFDKKIQPDCTMGLEDFSHIWIVFLFHMNNNHKHNNLAQTVRGHNFKSKVRPPKLRGKSVGVFCTRTPHRPNAVGLTLAKLDRVDGRTLHISALDLTDGTPVLDVKPYVPVYDALPTASCPSWCVDAALHRQTVSFTCEAIDAIDIAASQGRLKFYSTGSEIRKAIQQLLENDVRPDSSYRRYSDKSDSTLMHFRLDMLKIGYVRMSTGDSGPSTPHVQVREIVVETNRQARQIELGHLKRY